MRRRLGSLVLLALSGALLGCDDDDGSHYVAPYDVCAAHHGDATACQAEPGCRVANKILKAKMDENNRCLYFYADDFCIPDIEAAPPITNNANNVVEGFDIRYRGPDDNNNYDIFLCPRAGECFPFYKLGWPHLASNPELAEWCENASIINETCYDMTSKEECESAPKPPALINTDYLGNDVERCIWLEHGYTIGTYEDGQCKEIAHNSPTCVPASTRGNYTVNQFSIEYSTDATYVFHDYKPNNAVIVSAKDVTYIFEHPSGVPGTMVTKDDDGTIHIWGICTTDSTDPACSCTVNGTDATGT